MKKVVIGVIICVFLYAFGYQVYLNREYLVTDTFNNITLEKYQEDEFDELKIKQPTKDDDITKTTKDSKVINDLLSVFKELEIRKVKSKDVPNDIQFNSLYRMYFYNKDTYEYLWIDVWSDRYITIRSKIRTKKTNGSKNLIVWKSISSYGIYKIIDNNLDINNIKVIYSQLKEIKENN